MLRLFGEGSPERQSAWHRGVSFQRQHEVLAAACEEHALPQNPFGEPERQTALARALQAAAEIMAATPSELDAIVPPLEVLLP
jgi:hypothetical protein